MPVDWKDPDVKDRLLASIIASYDGKINCKEVARIFGDGATYNAIENFLRKPKKDAAELKANASGTASPAPSPARPRAPRTPKTPKTPREPKTPKSKTVLDGVKTGRVTKNQKLSKSTVTSEAEASENEGQAENGNADVDSLPAMFKEEEEEEYA